MRILIIAASASPYRGSEPSIGWKVARALCEGHEVHVVTMAGYRKELEKAEHEGLIPSNMRFHYHGQDWDEYPSSSNDKKFWWVAYRRFLATIRERIDGLIAEHQIELVHHVTFATWRMSAPIKNLPVPFVWGPVGGAEHFPAGMLGILSLKGIVFELVRYAATWASFLSPSIRSTVRDADAIVSSHPEMTRLFQRILGDRPTLHQLLVTAFTAEERHRILETGATPRAGDTPLKAFCGGLLEGRKGVSLAIEAIARAKKRGLKIIYKVCANGPELEHLKSLAAKHGLGEEVIFLDPLRGKEYAQELVDSDIYLLPSLRDNAPITLMEAMLARCVPVVADCGGPAYIVTDDCGIKVPTDSRGKAVQAIADALLDLQASPAKLNNFAEASRHRIMECFTMEAYLEKTEGIYASAMDTAKKRLAVNRG